MRIGYDLRPFLKEATGVGVYLKNLLFELARIDPDDEFFMVSASWKDRFPAGNIPPFAKGRFRDLRWPVRVLNFFWQDLGRPTLDRLAGVPLDLTHSATPLPIPTRGRTLVTVCDLFFMEDPARADREARRKFLKQTAEALRRADGVVTISEFSRRGIIERFGLPAEKVRAITLGVSPVFRRPAEEMRIAALRRELDIPGEFLLFVGASEPRKNLPRLIDALSILHRDDRTIPLVLVGRPGGDHSRLTARILEKNLSASVRLAGYRPDEDVRALYASASALVFPSLAEGFGLPLIEAMACGLPAAVSAVSALPEIGGAAVLYFDPSNAEAMAAAMERILRDDNLRAELRREGRERARLFDWARTAEATLDLYRGIVGRR